MDIMLFIKLILAALVALTGIYYFVDILILARYNDSLERRIRRLEKTIRRDL